MKAFNKNTLAACAALALTLLPTLAWAEGGGGDSEFITTAVFQLLNILILFAAGYYFGKKPFSKFLKDRKERITKELEEAEKLHEEARAALARYRSKIDSLDDERKSILEEYRRMGSKERDRIIADAKVQADKIGKDAQQTIENELLRAKTALESEVVTLAASLAEDAIREKLDRNKQKALVDAYLDDLANSYAEGAQQR